MKKTRTEVMIERNKHWQEKRKADAPRIAELCQKPHYLNDEQIGLKLGLSMSHVFKVRKQFNIEGGIVQERNDTRKRAVELWNQQQDWLWCRGQLGRSDSGFKKIMLELHESGEITLPAAYLMKRPKGFQMPVFEAKHQENAVKNAKLNRSKRDHKPEFWERLINATPVWIREHCEAARKERLARGAA